MKKNFVLITLLALVVFSAAPAQLDRTKVPGPGPAPAVAFPDYDIAKTSNGIRVIVVRNTELPTISIRMLIDRKPVLEKETAGAVELTGELLRNGTKNRTKDQIDEEVDLIGGDLGSNGTMVYASGLSKYTEKLVELMSDIVLHPSFPQDELDKLVTQTKSGLQYRKTEPNMIVDVVRRKVLFGSDHPYGEVQTEESVGKITRDKCMEVYNTYFKPNHAIIAVVGDVEKDQAVKLVEKYFGSWEEGTIPSPKYENPKPLDKVKVAFVDRPSSVQSVIRVSETIDLPRTSPDVLPVEVMNTVLGGGMFRLFINLREHHAYTYGAYSSAGPDELIGTFTASTSTKNAVTDSALTQIFYELNRIRDEKVEANELQMAKNYLSGSFVRGLEEANNVADDAINIERYNLPKDYYKTYLKRLDAITADDVQRAAKQYIRPDNVLIAVVGSAKDVEAKLAQFGPVEKYDEDGAKVVEKPAAAVTISADEIFAKFIAKTMGMDKLKTLKDKTLVMSAKVQEMQMKVTVVQKVPNKLFAQTEAVGMFKQRQGFDGKNGWMAGPQGTMDLTGEQLDAMKEEAVFNPYTEYKAAGIAVAVNGVKNIKGKDYYEVSFTGPSGNPMLEYFGVDDFLMYREVRTVKTPNGPVDQVADMLDYKDYGGYLMPSRIQQSVMGGTFEFTVESFKVNTGVKDEVFGKPKPE